MKNVRPSHTQSNAESAHLDSTISERIERVGRDLATSLRAFVESVPGAPHSPQKLAVALKLNKDLAHRLVTALRKKDSLATAFAIPGPEPLRRVIKAGLSRGVAPEIARPAEEAIQAFDGLIRREAGDRSGLDAVISAWLPDARAKFETSAKQLIYRGVRQIKGIAADVVFVTFLAHPSDDPARHDAIGIHGYLGVRRVRPGAAFKLSVETGVISPAGVALTLDEQPITHCRDVILREFCSGPPVELEVYEKGSGLVYALRWDGAVGLRSARDVVMAELRRRSLRCHRVPDDPRPKAGITTGITVPSRLYVCDLILHEDVFPKWEPRFRILETGELGAANPNDPTRDLDVLDLAERIEFLGTGIDRFRAAEIPNYPELLHFACKKVNWDATRFRGYRVRIEYPVFSSQLQFAFDLPLGRAGLRCGPTA